MALTPRAFAVVALALRVFILIVVLIAVILILTAPGVCFWRYLNGQQASGEICPTYNSIFPMSANRWNHALHLQNRGQNVWGQIAIIVVGLILALAPIGLSSAQFVSGQLFTGPQVLLSALAIVIFLILGGFETWYATGFDHMAQLVAQLGNGQFSGCAGFPGCQIVFVVKGWAGAAAMLFLSALLSLVDLGLALLNRQKLTGRRVILQRNTARASF